MCFTNYSLIAQISPGELSDAHAHLEGISNCVKCHSYGEQLKNSSCLSCHKEIEKLISESRGYHTSPAVRKKNCWDCHGEHFGREFRLIKFDRNKFDHSASGFPLTGKHPLLMCNDCHNVKFAGNKIRKKQTFLGLEQNCSYCHEDVHLNKLGKNCNACHNTSTFKPAESFDHQKAKFKLLGKHTDVSCWKCHTKEIINGKPVTKFTGIQFANCFPCHKDVHSGRLGKDCEKCHDVTGFNLVNKKNFNHDKTNYPLTGAHKSVDCRNCHKGDVTSRLNYLKCYDCHSDFHKGDFTKNNITKDCSECHATNSFSSSSFSINEHNQLDFKLTGAHLAVACRDCHFINSAWSFSIKDISCTGCHLNVHGKEIYEGTKKKYECRDCHGMNAWNDIYFNHSTTGYELAGKHKETSCKNCHYSEKENEKAYSFASTERKCITCHKDIHQGQFEMKGETGCSGCHSYDDWRPDKFDHSLTKFPLEGGHKNISCNKCHPGEERKGDKFVHYTMADFRCSACH